MLLEVIKNYTNIVEMECIRPDHFARERKGMLEFYRCWYRNVSTDNIFPSEENMIRREFSLL